MAAISLAQPAPSRRRSGSGAGAAMGDTGPVTNAVTTGRRAGAPIAPPTPEQARSTWPRMAGLGAALLVLGILALTWSDVGPRLLLGALGLFAAVRGTAVVRNARAGQGEGAVVGAVALWLGLVAVGVALLSATATGWVLVVGVVLAVAALAAGLPGRRGVLGAVAGVLAVGAVLVALLGGVDALLDTGRTVAAVGAVLVGLANLGGAVGMARIARRPAPAPAAGCGGCACGAGGCGSLG